MFCVIADGAKYLLRVWKLSCDTYSLVKKIVDRWGSKIENILAPFCHKVFNEGWYSNNPIGLQEPVLHHDGSL